MVLARLLARERTHYRDQPEDARALLSVGEAPRDKSIPVAEHAAWTQVAVIVLASDPAILLY